MKALGTIAVIAVGVFVGLCACAFVAFGVLPALMSSGSTSSPGFGQPTYSPRFDQPTYSTVEYVVESTLGASLTYENETGGTEQVKTYESQWRKTFKAKRGAFVYISAQTNGRGVSCKIIIDGNVFKQSSSSGQYTIASCSGTVP